MPGEHRNRTLAKCEPTPHPSFRATPQQMIGSEPVDEVERLQRQASALETTAEALTRAYNRATWIRFLLVFIPVPFVVLLLRLYLDAWGYYAAGGAFIVCGAALFSLDSAASAKCAAATREPISADGARCIRSRDRFRQSHCRDGRRRSPNSRTCGGSHRTARPRRRSSGRHGPRGSGSRAGPACLSARSGSAAIRRSRREAARSRPRPATGYRGRASPPPPRSVRPAARAVGERPNIRRAARQQCRSWIPDRLNGRGGIRHSTSCNDDCETAPPSVLQA